MAGSSPADVEKNTRIQPNEINDDAGVIDQTDAASNLKGTQEVLDPFGYDDGEIQYKTMKWWQGSLVMVAENISLGILSLPAVLDTVGYVGGVIAIVLLGIFSTYSGYVLWQFRMRHPHIANYADIGGVLFGNIGREIFGVAYVLYMVFCMGSHILTFTIAMNVLTGHATCTIVWGVVGLVVFGILTIPRTLKNVAFMSIISFTSIFSAVMLTMIALGVQPRASLFDMKAFGEPKFPVAFNSISNIVFAYGGHVAWISFISELRDPREFPKALFLQQGMCGMLYTTAALVIYRFAGPNVASPALNSNGPIIRKVAWGIALPTIVIAGVIFAHVTAKYVYLRMFAGTAKVGSRGFVATATWIGLGSGFWILAFVIAESIPSFSDLLGFISALFASWFSYGIPGLCWFVLNKGSWFHGGKQTFLSCINLTEIILGFIICGAGLYASGYQMHQDTAGSVWSCADNSS